MAKFNHSGVVETDMIDDRYTAACSCGWAGASRSTSAEAEGDLLNHYEEQRGPDLPAGIGPRPPVEPEA